MYQFASKNMTVCCTISMIFFILNRFFTIRSYIATFSICMNATFLSIFNNFLIIDATAIEVRLVVIKSDYFSA